MSKDDDDSWNPPPSRFNADERGPFPLTAIVVAIAVVAAVALGIWILATLSSP